MSQRWKVALIGLLTVGATTLASTLTTAYLMRPPAPASPAIEPPPAAEPESRAPIVRIAPPHRQHRATPPRSRADEVGTAP